MIEALIVALREGVEAALIVGIALVYLARIGRRELRKIVYLALAAGCAGSVALAVALSHLTLNVDIVEGWIMLAAAFFVVTMIVFMTRAARALKGNIEARIGHLAGAGSRAGLFVFIFLMVLREGVETVLILAAVSLNTTALLDFLGTVAGLLLAVLFGVMFVKGSVRVDLGKFFRMTTVILCFVAIQLVASGLHELSENGVLPSSRTEMSLIGPIVRNDIVFFVAIVALAGLIFLFDTRRRQSPPEPGESRAEERLAAWSARRERLWMAGVYVSAFVFITFVTAHFVSAKQASALSPSIALKFEGGNVTVNTADLRPGSAHRYSVDVDGILERFLVYRRPDGSLATVLDACAICGAPGFNVTGSGMTCRACAAPVNPASIGLNGGCNPLPLRATVKGASVTVASSELAKRRALFEVK